MSKDIYLSHEQIDTALKILGDFSSQEIKAFLNSKDFERLTYSILSDFVSTLLASLKEIKEERELRKPIGILNSNKRGDII